MQMTSGLSSAEDPNSGANPSKLTGLVNSSLRSKHYDYEGTKGGTPRATAPDQVVEPAPQNYPGSGKGSNQLIGVSSTAIHSPTIKTSNKKKKDRMKKSLEPIDVTMTSYAIDQSFLETRVQGDQVQFTGKSKTIKNSNSPVNTRTAADRGKGTQAMFQLAQKDPNSFLHTQPIHFDNYYVQARPLNKTIYSNQYKKAQEKLEKSRKYKQRLFTLSPPIDEEKDEVGPLDTQNSKDSLPARKSPDVDQSPRTLLNKDNIHYGSARVDSAG